MMHLFIVCARPFDLTISDFDPQLAALLTLLFIIIINLAVGILPHVDNFAHIGGFVSGFLLGFLFLIHPQFKWLAQWNDPLNVLVLQLNLNTRRINMYCGSSL